MAVDAPRPPRPSFRLLSGFEAAARTGSFTEAGAELGVSRSAISHQIRQLEDCLGTPLFMRTQGKPRLTKAGMILARHVAVGMAEIRRGLDTVSRHGGANRISLSAPPFFAARFLGQGPKPKFDLNLIVESRLADFEATTVDAAVRFGDGHWPGLCAERLFDVSYAPVCAPQLCSGKTDRRDVVADATRLVFAGEGKAWSAVDTALCVRRSERAKSVSYDSFVGALQACLDGQGVMIAPIEIMGDQLRDGSLIQLSDQCFPSDHSFFVVATKARFDQPELVSLRRWLKSAVKRKYETAMEN